MSEGGEGRGEGVSEGGRGEGGKREGGREGQITLQQLTSLPLQLQTARCS